MPAFRISATRFNLSDWDPSLAPDESDGDGAGAGGEDDQGPYLMVVNHLTQGMRDTANEIAEQVGDYLRRWEAAEEAQAVLRGAEKVVEREQDRQDAISAARFGLLTAEHLPESDPARTGRIRRARLVVLEAESVVCHEAERKRAIKAARARVEQHPQPAEDEWSTLQARRYALYCTDDTNITEDMSGRPITVTPTDPLFWQPQTTDLPVDLGEAVIAFFNAMRTRRQAALADGAFFPQPPRLRLTRTS